MGPELQLERRVAVVRGALELREVVGESEGGGSERLQQEPVGPVEGQGRRHVLVDHVECRPLKNDDVTSGFKIIDYKLNRPIQKGFRESGERGLNNPVAEKPS